MPVAQLRSVAEMHSRRRVAGRLLTPADIPGLVAWYDPTDATTITQAGGFVSQINDKSSNGYHLAQGTGANQPAYVVGGVNGNNTIQFAGNHWLLNTGINLNGASYSAFTIGRLTSGSGTLARLCALSVTGVGDVGVNGFIPLVRQTTEAQISAYAGAAHVDHSISLDVWMMLAVSRAAATLVSYFNGGNNKTASPTNALAALTRICVGSGITSTGAADTHYWVGSWAGTLLYSGVLADADRQKVEGCLAWNLGLQAQLVADHPYFSSPPRAS